MRGRSGVGLLLLLATVPLACSDGSSRAVAGLEELASPAGSGAMAPYLTTDGDDLLLSWLEPGHRFLMARLHAGEWSDPVVIAEGDDFFANWADVPKVAVAGDGTLWAHWLAKTGAATYAYGIFLARSSDGGVSWQPMGTLHDDATPTEHGFVSFAVEGDGLRAVWLDGREMEGGGPMTVRTARLDGAVGESIVIDDRVCECCPTTAAATSTGMVALYRDRSPEEIRNIAMSRFDGESWSAPEALHDDGWRIAGCPVNGPAADARGNELVVAWFTAAQDEPIVRLAFSHDGGTSFEPPQRVDGNRPLGRVGVALDVDGSAWVSWLGTREKLAEVRLGHFTAGGEGDVVTVATTEASRASGIPRLARAAGTLFIAWVEADEERTSVIRLAARPTAQATATGRRKR